MPQHQVRITEGFWLFDSPCTQELWQAVMGWNPSHFTGAKRPVENVSWDDCQDFFRQLPEVPIALPTEAQWEYACRAGSTGAYYGEELQPPLSLTEIAWFDKNSDEQTHEVGQKAANSWGLYDTLGNVWEWCHDGKREYENRPERDPLGPVDEKTNTLSRGGGWLNGPHIARAAARFVWIWPSPIRQRVMFPITCWKLWEAVSFSLEVLISPSGSKSRIL